MIQEQTLKETIALQHKNNLLKENLTPRKNFEEFINTDQFATVISGIRRCGKSTVLLLWQRMLRDEQVIYLDFDNTKLFGFEMNDFTILDKIIQEEHKTVLFFDEIQVVEGWEIYIREKLNEGYKIVITGSNASLLSRELGTKLTGRHISCEMFPFSYDEYLQYTQQPNTLDSFKGYSKTGGFPEFLRTGNTAVLQSLFDDIIYRDITIRYGIRDVSTFKKLAIYLLSNIGCPVSANRLKQVMNIKSSATVLDYFSYLENSYIVFFVPVFSYSQKVQMITPRKVYAIDTGLSDAIGRTFSPNEGRILENMVFMHLRRKYKEIYYFNNKREECDFVVVENGRVTELVQVCTELTHDNKMREFAGMNTAIDELNPLRCTLVTLNYQDSYRYKQHQVDIIPANLYFVSY